MSKEQYAPTAVEKDNISTKDIDRMSIYQLCRWTALEEAVNLIGDKCDERGIDFQTTELKPLDILQYIEKATDNIYAKYIGT